MPPKRKPPVRRGPAGYFGPPPKQTKTVEKDSDESDSSDDSEVPACSIYNQELEEREKKKEEEKASDASKGVLTFKEDYIYLWDTGRSKDSPTVEVQGIPWHINASKRTVNGSDWLAVFLCGFNKYPCGASSIQWSVDVTAEYIVVNENQANNVVTRFSSPLNQTVGSFGFSRLIAWEDLINKDKGFMSKSGCIVTINVNFTLSNIVGFGKTPVFYFTRPDPRHDLTVVIGRRKLYTSSQMLSIHSPVLNSLLCSSSEQRKKNEIMLNEVEYENFIEMLHFIYPGRNKITKDNVLGLLAVAGRFQIQALLDQLEQYLIKSTEFKTAAKLKFAVEHRLVQLQDRCLSLLKDSEDIKNLKKSDEYNKFNDTTKIVLFDRLMKLTK